MSMKETNEERTAMIEDVVSQAQKEKRSEDQFMTDYRYCVHTVVGWHNTKRITHHFETYE